VRKLLSKESPALLERYDTASFLNPALWTEPGNSSLRKRYSNLGAQIDLRFSVMHWYEMTLSFGYAVGYRGSDRAGSEWMVSLQVM